MWNRWTEALSLTDKQAREALQYPYQLSGPKPRYYQEAAINRAIIAVLQTKRNLREPRILLTLATGTGKTKIAFQLVWKLKKARAIRNVLYLTDRDWLLSQAMDNDFAPFGDARQRILGEAKTSRDIVFATYQAIADNETRAGLYHDFPRDFFDVIIVDECHRGSAQDDSRWHTILEYFESAVQIGMTATPLSTDAVQTDAYFGKPIYTYSLRTGINDGFLAPYRVRRVLMGEKQVDEQDEQPAETEISETSDTRNAAVATVAGVASVAGGDEDENFSVDPILEETSATLRVRTRAIAKHLATYMQQTDPLGKTIVFCVDQDHAEKMREALERACAENVMRYRGYIERIVSEEGIEGKRALGRFSTPGERTPVIVTTSRLLSTGVDVPTCKNIVLARPVGSLVEFKQIIGRGSRLYEPEKTWFTIIDYAGAIKLFFDPNFDGDPELVEVEPLVPQLQSQPEEVSVVMDTPGTPVIKEDATSSLEGQHVVEVPVPLLPGSLVSAVSQERPEEFSYQAAIAAATSLSELAPAGAEPPMPGNTAVIPQSSETENAAVTAQPPLSRGDSTETPVPGPVSEPPPVVKQTRSGRTIQVIGEYVYDLGPDGKTLISRSFYRDYTASTLKGIVQAPADLRARWLSREQREALRDQLEEEGVDLQALAAALHHPDVDPLDLLLHVAFGQDMPTRSDRVKRLNRDHADFFNSYKPEARAMLKVILEKYIAGEAEDVSDTELLKVPPLKDQGTFIELAKPFGGGSKVRNALQELQVLLYSA